jgi:hypothetical protein
MAAMREWLDGNRSEPTKFKYDQEDEAMVVWVEFLDDRAGEAFARRFDGKASRGPTLPAQ